LACNPILFANKVNFYFIGVFKIGDSIEIAETEDIEFRLRTENDSDIMVSPFLIQKFQQLIVNLMGHTFDLSIDIGHFQLN
jgi:hypothetical protein